MLPIIFRSKNKRRILPLNTVLYIPFNGVNGSSSIVDVINTNRSISNQNVIISNVQSFKGSTSGLFQNFGSFLETPHAADLTFGNSNFSIEAYIYLLSLPQSYAGDFGTCIIGKTSTAANFTDWYILLAGSTYSSIQFGYYFGTLSSQRFVLSRSFNFSLNVWYKVGVKRINNNIGIYINDILQGDFLDVSSQPSMISNTSTPIQVGQFNDSTFRYWLRGYMDDLLITKG